LDIAGLKTGKIDGSIAPLEAILAASGK